MNRSRRRGKNFNTYAGSTILVTGGTGSIGLELVRSLLQRNPKEVRIFSNDENGLFEASYLLGTDRVKYVLGDVRDSGSVERAVPGCDYVFHAAALKHVDFCESNPTEAILTNVVGTENVIGSSLKYRVKRFIFISTDKAVNPVSTMGATKLLGEKLVSDASRLTQSGVPCFSIVRFGNVVGSRGSVVAIFRRNVREGRPITVTNPMMTRFVMPPSDASGLILQASEVAMQGELFILKMKSVRIGDLAEVCKAFFAKRYGIPISTVKTVVTGAQPGEKLHEELMTEGENIGALDFGRYIIVNPHGSRMKVSSNSSQSHSLRPISSNLSPSASSEEIHRILSELEA